jgi:hypothetical protein
MRNSLYEQGFARNRSFRHAGEGRHPRLAFARQAKSWMPAFAGMTLWDADRAPSDAVMMEDDFWPGDAPAESGS